MEWKVVPAVQGNGGLYNAIRAAAEEGLDKTWVGNLGFPTDVLGDQTKEDIQDKMNNEYEALTVYVDDGNFDGAYNHYCKTILWPVFHYQIPDNPKSKAYLDHSWKYYVKMNECFADKIVANYKRSDTIWINDYHLLLLPGMIRKRLPDAKIGFFLHSAFPSSEVFRCLAPRKELLEGMLGANLVAFQTPEYAQHFLQTCSRLLVVEATTDGINLDDRFVNVTHLPIGIDPKSLADAREDPAVAQSVQSLQERYHGKQLIVARDKLDHVRGVRQKLLAYEYFLNTNPEWQDKVVLIQVATSTTEQAGLEATISDIVTRINSTFSTLSHQPLIFLKQDIASPQYLALLSVADTLLITSLREGMNLTSHEYLFCQDGKYGDKKHGPLILSEFTGSASILGNKGMLPVNPWDYRQCANAIKKALQMRPEEKERRYNGLREIVMHNTGARWARTLDDHLRKVHEEHLTRDAATVPRLNFPKLAESYKRAQRRIFILDYEGTLAAYSAPTRVIQTSPQRVIDTLNDLLADPQNVVYVMSGRTPEELDRLFTQVPRLGIIAETGSFVKEFETDEWLELADVEQAARWKEGVAPILKYYQERIESSWIEERHCSLIFHYDKSPDMEGGVRQAGDCANHINEACEGQKVHAVPIDHSVLVESWELSKGSAAKLIFEKLKEKDKMAGGKEAKVDWLFVAGDDRADEVIFRWANGLGGKGEIRDVMTVSLGKRNTEAMATLPQGVTGKSGLWIPEVPD